MPVAIGVRVAGFRTIAKTAALSGIFRLNLEPQKIVVHLHEFAVERRGRSVIKALQDHDPAAIVPDTDDSVAPLRCVVLFHFCSLSQGDSARKKRFHSFDRRSPSVGRLVSGAGASVTGGASGVNWRTSSPGLIKALIPVLIIWGKSGASGDHAN